MSHMVIFQTPDGSPGYNQFETVEEAVDFVEKLRNDQSIENARMFALEEIKFELKPYFKVELQALNRGPEPQAQPAAAPAAGAEGTTTFGSYPPPPAQSPAPAYSAPAPPSPPSDAPAGDDQPARRGLFGR